MRDAIPVAVHQKRSGAEAILIILFSAIALLIHLLTNGRYGYFRDELYYIACGQHLAFGYVDQPPLSILLLRLSEVFLGNSLFAIRFLPALAGAATVAITGLIARELGGRAWAIGLACAGSLCALFNLAVGNFFSMNAFEPLFWMGCMLLFSAGLFFRGALKASGLNPGFVAAGDLVTELDFSLIKKDPADARRLIFAAVQRARDLPGVKTAAVGTMLPYGNFTNSRRIMPPTRVDRFTRSSDSPRATKCASSASPEWSSVFLFSKSRGFPFVGLIV